VCLGLDHRPYSCLLYYQSLVVHLNKGCTCHRLQKTGLPLGLGLGASPRTSALLGGTRSASSSAAPLPWAAAQTAAMSTGDWNPPCQK
jgi:hypothetical protein